MQCLLLKLRQRLFRAIKGNQTGLFFCRHTGDRQLNAITKISLIGILTVAGTSAAVASNPTQHSQPATRFVDLSFALADAAAIQQVHYRSYRHNHRGVRSNRFYRSHRSHRFHPRHFRQYGYSNRHRRLGYGYRYDNYYPRYYRYHYRH